MVLALHLRTSAKHALQEGIQKEEQRMGAQLVMQEGTEADLHRVPHVTDLVRLGYVLCSTVVRSLR